MKRSSFQKEAVYLQLESFIGLVQSELNENEKQTNNNFGWQMKENIKIETRLQCNKIFTYVIFTAVLYDRAFYALPLTILNGYLHFGNLANYRGTYSSTHPSLLA
jgi:hypothetical protein